MKRAVLYLRVSTLDQTTVNQERELREVASRMGCEIVRVYKDHGISGAKGRDKRPGFDALIRDANQRKFDMVMAWSVDRLGRSLQDLVGFLSELHALHIDLFLHQQGLDTTTPTGKAMFQMMGVFAEFERAMIAERVRAGLRRAKDEGKQLGRPRIAPESPGLRPASSTRSPWGQACRRDYANPLKTEALPCHFAGFVSRQTSSANVRSHGVDRACRRNAYVSHKRCTAITVAPHASMLAIDVRVGDSIEIGVAFQ